MEFDIINEIITHELQHIFINYMGNKTNDKYFIVNNLIKITSGRTLAFLTLYYLSFKDEILSNVQMFHKKIKTNKIKTKSEFISFLKEDNFNSIVNKMINVNILDYWNHIIEEGNNELLISELNLNRDNLNNQLLKIENFIKKSGKVYKSKISKIFL
jgi:hypothetical protein